MNPVRIDSNRLVGELLELAKFSDAPAPAVTRVVFTQRDVEARAWLKSLFAEAGLSIREDGIGNVFARWEGSEPQLPAVGTGSHIDAIPHSGLYDGCVGVLGGLEAIRALQRSGFAPHRSIELLVFNSEEPTRFGIGCTGSRALAGQLSAQALEKLKDAEGISYPDAARSAGFSGRIDNLRLANDYYSAFVELHIEQGPLLEREGVPLGAVTAIAAPASLEVQVHGEGGHAGALLMRDRHDALCAAAECVLAVEKHALSTGAVDTVGTVGILDIHPRAVNSVPSHVFFTIDCRDTDAARRDGVLGAIAAEFSQIATRRAVRIESKLLNADPPATCDAKILAAIDAACGELQLRCKHMVSRAYHDSLFMARVCPTGMIFIPCRGGISHRPDEFSSSEALASGTAVLASALARLSHA